MNKTMHEMKLQPEPFEAIKVGKKVIESRLNDEKRRLIKVGDIIEFKKMPELTSSVKTKAIALLYYPDFDALFSDFDPNWFGLPTKAALLAQVDQFYSVEEQVKYGVVGIKIKLL